jgi:hypothetical protein
MGKTDIVVRTPADLERKYNFASLLGLKKNVEINNQSMQKIENELNSMLHSLTINLKDVLDSQSEISLWFYSGIPTTSNEPYTLWENPSVHIGDIYYNQSSGEVYQFSGEDWEINNDENLINSMAITNAEIDTTGDHERKVYFKTPTTPYSNGDWWIKEDGSLFICQISKPAGEKFADTDFIIANQYTTGTNAKMIDNRLTIMEGRITTIETSNNDLNIEFVNQKQIYDTLDNKVVGIEGKLDDMSFNFSTNGLAIGTTTDVNNSLLDNTGIRVYNYDKLNAIFNHKGSGIDKLIVTGEAQIGYLKCVKSTKNGKPVTKIFHLKNLVETLSDLEV